jgi:hypothetical protein
VRSTSTAILSLPIVESPLAEDLYRSTRRGGLTIRSSAEDAVRIGFGQERKRDDD